MKKIISLTFFAFVWINLLAQTPQAINYQAVARNSSGQVLASQPVSFKISILSGSASGTAVYTETHAGKTTNQFGLVNLAIGKGTPVTGTLSAVAWDAGNYYIKVEMDPAGGTSYQALGTSQLLSVPYALHSKTTELEADGDPANEIQELQLSGTVLGLTKSTKTVTLPSSGGGDNWGTQSVVTDATLSGNGTTSAPLKIAQQSATNGQVLKWNGSSWAPGGDEAGGFTLPWSGTATNTTQALKITNTGSGVAISGESTAGSGVIGMTDGTNTSGVFGLAHALSGKNYGVRGENDSPDGYSGYFIGSKFYISSNTGIGIENPSAKLDVDGQIKIRGGSPGDGKVLTSDANGLASWLTPSGGGFTLPYSSTVSHIDYIFNIINEGSGSGMSVIAKNTIGAANGIYAESKAEQGRGVVGLASSLTGDNYGVLGGTKSNWGIGVYGLADATTGTPYAVVGRVMNPNAYSGYFIDGRFYIGGNTGIGTENPTAKLEVNGQVKITGGSPGAGKVLTSDANGLASWQSSGSGPFSSVNGITRNDIISDHFVVGALTLTDSEGSSDDSRLFFHKTKGALRAGYAYGDIWNDANVGSYSTAFGNMNKASGSSSFAMGQNSSATGSLSVAYGLNSVASGNNSTAFGHNSIASAYCSFVIGRNNVGGGNLTVWSASDPVFEIGIGGSADSRANALTVLKNGNTGIGTPSPGYKLDVAGESRIRLINGSEWIALRNDGSAGFVDLQFAGGNLVIQGNAAGENIFINPGTDSKVGIRSWAAPQYELDVNGKIRATGGIYYGGTPGNSNGTEYIKPDFVFDNSYKSLTTDEVEEFLSTKKHLPWVTSAIKEKEENGDVIDMTRMAFETLETVENLQLQLIKQNKLIRKLKDDNDLLKNRLENLEQLVGTMAEK